MNDLEVTTPASSIPEVRLTLLADPSTVGLAREFVRYALSNWGFDAKLINDSMLVMSEIVTNAVTAVPGHEIRLRCALQDRAPLLECWDLSPELPTPRPASLTAENGRGLTIISAYAKKAGTRPCPTGEGKVVWALMPT